MAPLSSRGVVFRCIRCSAVITYGSRGRHLYYCPRVAWIYSHNMFTNGVHSHRGYVARRLNCEIHYGRTPRGEGQEGLLSPGHPGHTPGMSPGDRPVYPTQAPGFVSCLTGLARYPISFVVLLLLVHMVRLRLRTMSKIVSKWPFILL